jgi:hypothetical protein
LSIADKGFHLNPTVAAATLKKMRMEKMSFASAAKQKKDFVRTKFVRMKLTLFETRSLFLKSGLY